MKIENVRWGSDHGRCHVDVRLDGYPARIRQEQKPTLIERGIISLGEEWDRRIPEIVLEDLAAGIGRTVLRGCTDDPTVFALWEEITDATIAGVFQSGPRPSR